MKISSVLLSLMVGVGLAFSATLRPSAIVYGIVRDSYGIRLGPDAATISAFLGTNEVARTVTKLQPGGANYRFEVNVSDPLTAGPGEVTPGATVVLRVKIGGAFQPVIGPNSFAAPGDGASVNLNLQLGEDTDGDGIPDDWERMVIANSGGAITNLSQVGPGRDLDGDGIPDDQEFLNGSFAFLADDVLRMSSLAQHQNGRLSFSFTALQGVSYWVEATPSLSDPNWTINPIALSETGNLVAGEFTGDGKWTTVYMAKAGPTHFYRLRGR